MSKLMDATLKTAVRVYSSKLLFKFYSMIDPIICEYVNDGANGIEKRGDTVEIRMNAPMTAIDCLEVLIEIRTILTGRVKEIRVTPRFQSKLMKEILKVYPSPSYIPMGQLGALAGWPVFLSDKTEVL
jgi:hypothetical protein